VREDLPPGGLWGVHSRMQCTGYPLCTNKPLQAVVKGGNTFTTGTSFVDKPRAMSPRVATALPK
jgi:hypothetical protein